MSQSWKEHEEAQVLRDIGASSERLSAYIELETKLEELRDSFHTAAEQTHGDNQQRSYRAGLSDGFNIALLMLRQTNVKHIA